MFLKEVTMIRAAVPSDFEDIARCIHAAFQSEVEVGLVQELRADQDVLLDLVAERRASIVGHVMVSKLVLYPDLDLRCGGVAPLSVTPAYQGMGIGAELMNEVLLRSRGADLDALFLLGDPAYYQRFGFKITAVKSDYPAPYFQAFELTPKCLHGHKAQAFYASAFAAL